MGRTLMTIYPDSDFKGFFCFLSICPPLTPRTSDYLLSFRSLYAVVTQLVDPVLQSTYGLYTILPLTLVVSLSRTSHTSPDTNCHDINLLPLFLPVSVVSRFTPCAMPTGHWSAMTRIQNAYEQRRLSIPPSSGVGLPFTEKV